MPRIWEIVGVVAVAVVCLVATARGVEKFAAMRAHDAEIARIRQQLFDAVQPVTVANCTLARVGDANDGGYLVCGNLLGAVQSAYSYGIAGTDNWGCQISQRLSVPVHEYDCFDLRQPSCADGRLIFHPECVGPSASTEDGRPFDSIADQVQRNGDADKALVMKMDVEGADAVFDRIDQLVMEFHGVDDERYVRAVEKLKRAFVFAHIHYNNYGCRRGVEPFHGWVFEALLVNKRIAQTDGSPAPRGPLPNLDAPNGPQIPDCQ